ncbi:TraR/DksA C4-type zinc finger protein [Kingella sp. (in: b-proteobacteria)]|uniref:TraR/DksA C4-type zinc finger protein n=1 Tax=Kingella sp. (in: b-proteobacteria) TaxID=2020713 RepID=UPI0026DBD26D|nr:TraR/DksA C4-type zinc finger protein [Kingella sp. (in: b-proteobacteria)]MDO4658338.1 TraR/DksA C4-type zinc finger protein [Kingella sp. (in: b-proteobacteria)]
MSRQIDQACELEELYRQAAITHQAKQNYPQRPSARHCQECGDIIPEARRRAAVGCQYCIDCQERIEHEKTRYFAR